MPSNGSWWEKNGFATLIIAAIIFLSLVFIFRNRISKTLENKEDFPWFKTFSQHPKKRIIQKKNEKKCREIFENIFRRPFPSARPDFLRRKNGYCLELDGWCPELKLAFEYQGSQHYKFNKRFHRSMEDFEKQKQRDEEKKKLCEKHGVKLIEIPYTVPYEKLESYIRGQVKSLQLFS